MLLHPSMTRLFKEERSPSHSGSADMPRHQANVSEGWSYRVCCICSSIPCVSGVKWSTYTYLSKKNPSFTRPRNQRGTSRQAGRPTRECKQASVRPTRTRPMRPATPNQTVDRGRIEAAAQRTVGLRSPRVFASSACGAVPACPTPIAETDADANTPSVSRQPPAASRPSLCLLVRLKAKAQAHRLTDEKHRHQNCPAVQVTFFVLCFF